jgi:hypothetical protein
MSGSLPRGGPVKDPPPPDRFDPARILAVLDRHGVQHILVGGLAATLHGSPTVTFDIDLTPEQSRQNLERLAAALTELGAYTDPDQPMKPPSADDFAYMVASFASPVGYIDVFRETQAVGGFDRLQDRAEEVEVAGLRIRIADLDDIIASKEAADRPKDRAQLPLLYALREERSGQSGG